jgi:cyclophilin family peptidyl-prolyl cis-trans isomerase
MRQRTPHYQRTLPTRRTLQTFGAIVIALSLTACGGPIVHDLVPLPGKEDQVPEITEKVTIAMVTTAGEIVIEVYPEAAPNAAQRFVELVESGYYDGTPILRVVPGFVAQFGINWRDDHIGWRDRSFDDDPRIFAHERGTLSFAKAGPDTAATQVFINLANNNRLADDADPRLRFSVFGAVVEGMDVVDDFVVPRDVEDTTLDQPRLWRNGQAYLDQLELKPTMIDLAVVR